MSLEKRGTVMCTFMEMVKTGDLGGESRQETRNMLLGAHPSIREYEIGEVLRK